MESNQQISSESFCYSIRLSFETESFIEFDLKFLMSTRWDSSEFKDELNPESFLLPTFPLDSPSKSLLFHSSRHQSRYLYAVPCLSAAKVSTKQRQSDTAVKHHGKARISVPKHLWFVLTKICKKFMRKNCGESCGKDLGKEGDFIHDRALCSRKLNLGSLIEEECKS